MALNKHFGLIANKWMPEFLATCLNVHDGHKATCLLVELTHFTGIPVVRFYMISAYGANVKVIYLITTITSSAEVPCVIHELQ